MADEGFLRRWARRKAAGRPAEAAPPRAPDAAPPLPAASRAGLAPAAPPRVARLGAEAPASAPAPVARVDAARTAASAAAPVAPSAPTRLPTLDDAARLTSDSDFSAFVARGVDAAVRRAALKTLFADPHFNAMDGLDVYIGDYTQPSPVSDAMLASLAHARQVLRRTVDVDVDTDREAAPDAAMHVQPQPQQPPEPGHDDYPPDRRTDDA